MENIFVEIISEDPKEVSVPQGLSDSDFNKHVNPYIDKGYKVQYRLVL